MKKIICHRLSWVCLALVLLTPVGLVDTDLPANSRLSFQPLGKQEKFDYFVQHTFTMGDILERSALAGIAQWRDSPPEWGRVWQDTDLGWAQTGQYSIKKTLQFSIGAARPLPQLLPRWGEGSRVHRVFRDTKNVVTIFCNSQAAPLRKITASKQTNKGCELKNNPTQPNTNTLSSVSS